MKHKVVSFEIKTEGSLLSRDSAHLWDELTSLLDDLEKVPDDAQCGVFLILEGSHSDFSISFLNELRSELFLDELYGRMRKAQKIVQRIFKSRHTWVFGFDGDCFGNYFDLALACDYRFCFHPLAQCGFHEIATHGLFPTLGGLKHRIPQNLRSRKEWLKSSVFNVNEAVYQGFIDAVDYSTTWKKDIAHWIEEKISDGQPSSVKKDHSERPPIDTDDPENLTKGIAFKKISDLLSTEQNNESQNRSNIFEYGFRHLTADSKHYSADEAFAVIAYFCARRMLNSHFLNWWARRGQLLGSLVEYTPSKVQVVYIDLNHLIPPVQALARLIDSGYVIFFYAHRVLELQEGLDLIYTRFERNYSKEKVESYWLKGVCWFVGDVDEKNQPNPIMRWYPDDRLIVHAKEKSLSFLRFEGNRGSSICGWAELSVNSFDSEEISSDLYRVVRVMSDGIISTKQLPNAKMDLSTFIRSLFLEELINVSISSTKDIIRTLGTLKEEEWRYIAEENSWEYFLRSRDESYRESSIGTEVGALQVSERCWKLGVWREVKQLVKSKATQGSYDLKNSYIFLSQHFCYFAALLANIIEKEKLVKSRSEADIFVSEVAGFPKHLGTPLSFMESQGKSRFHHYIDRHWPQSTLSRR